MRRNRSQMSNTVEDVVPNTTNLLSDNAGIVGTAATAAVVVSAPASTSTAVLPTAATTTTTTSTTTTTKALLKQHHSSSSLMAMGYDNNPQDNENNNNNNSNRSTNHTNNNNTHIRPTWFVIQVTSIASLGGILFGYDLGVVSSALPPMSTAFQLTSAQQEVVVSVLYLGGGIGALVGGSLCDAFGRKRAILFTDVWFLVGAIVLFAAPDVTTIVFGRIIVGFAVAVSGVADVSYLHEIAPIQFRGAIVSVNEACISLGFLLAFAAGTVLGNVENGWRTMFGLSGLIAFVQWVGMLSMPESPTWLQQQNRHEEAEEALRRIHGDVEVVSDHVRTSPAAPIRDNSSNSNLANGAEGEYAGTTIRDGGEVGRRTGIVRSASYDSSSISNFRNNAIARSTSATAATATTLYDAVPLQTTSASAEVEGGGHYVSETTSAGATSVVPNRNCGTRNGLIGRCTVCCCQCVYLMQQLLVFAKETLTHYRRQAYIALFLSITQQFCGQTNVLSYAPHIFAQASRNNNNNNNSGDSDPDGSAVDATATVQGWSTLSIGIVKFLVTVIVIWKIENIGRRVLLLVGMGTIAVGLFCLAVAFYEGDVDDNDTTADVGRPYLALPGVLLVVCGYSMSFGPLTWLLTSELFPTDIRGRALGFSTIVTYLCAALVTVTFLSAQEWIGPSVVFVGYLFVTCLGLVFAYTAIPDTKCKTTKEIEQDLDQMTWWKGLQRHWRHRGGDDASPLFRHALSPKPIETELT